MRLRTYIAGSSHCEMGEEAVSALPIGTVFELERRPRNPHDPLAIAIVYGERQAGWVPKRNNRAIAEAMDAGRVFSCVKSDILAVEIEGDVS